MQTEEPIRRQQATRTRTSSPPKYAELEIERRFLVDSALLPDLSEPDSTLIVDLYLHCGRLRLRKMTSPDDAVLYKLCKKYGKSGSFQEPITNLYLSEQEHVALAQLPGDSLVKRRYKHPFEGRIFSIDIHLSPHAGLALCEIEAASVEELLSVQFPPYALSDVSYDERYSGAQLAKNVGFLPFPGIGYNPVSLPRGTD